MHGRKVKLEDRYKAETAVVLKVGCKRDAGKRGQHKLQLGEAGDKELERQK